MTARAMNTACALADRKGVTSIEYAFIAGIAATAIVASYNELLTRVVALLSPIVFP